MTDRRSGGPVRTQRVAEVVAQRLRERILSGELADGALLPKEDDLRDEYPVSKPSLREALRILETEGMLTVRRGNQGGAVVHRPTAVDAGYMFGLVLSGQGTSLADVATALREVEPQCAALCALRRDRRESVVPVLADLQAQAVAAVDDLVNVSALARRFHESIVELCGNQTLTLVAGVLESIWSAHERRWAVRAADEVPTQVPVRSRRREIDVHAEIIELIRSGDAAGVRSLVADHLARVQRYPSPPGEDPPVEPALLRP